jgi:hypothetical protein
MVMGDWKVVFDKEMTKITRWMKPDFFEIKDNKGLEKEMIACN